MRRWAFVIAILGMMAMLFLINLPAQEVASYEDIADLEVNTRVRVAGEIVGERIIYGNEKLLSLDKGIEMVYYGDGRFNGESVEVVGLVSEYNGKKQMTIEKISVLG